MGLPTPPGMAGVWVNVTAEADTIRSLYRAARTQRFMGVSGVILMIDANSHIQFIRVDAVDSKGEMHSGSFRYQGPINEWKDDVWVGCCACCCGGQGCVHFDVSAVTHGAGKDGGDGQFITVDGYNLRYVSDQELSMLGLK